MRAALRLPFLVCLVGLVLTATPALAQVPGEVTGLRWCASAPKSCLEWDAALAANGYQLYAGDDAGLTCLMHAGPDSCGSWLAETTTGPDALLAANPPSGSFRWFLVGGWNDDGNGSVGSASSGERVADTERECSAGCSSTGAACTNDNDCCIGSCADGVCATPCCGLGSACSSAADCCSGVCEGGVCCDPAVCCRPAGSTCTQGGQCCTGNCDGGRCCVSLGSNFCCMPYGTPCGADGCCPGNACYLGSCARQIMSVCYPGDTCAGGAICDPSHGTCCFPDGAYVDDCVGCCSSTCTAGTCGRVCTPSGGSCSPSGPNHCCTSCDPSTRRCS